MTSGSSQFQISPIAVQAKNEKYCLKLLFGIVGIYISLLISALLNQKILKHQYKSFEAEGASATFSYPIVFLLVPHFFGFLIGRFYNSFQKQTPHIPKLNLLKISVTVLISGLTFNAAILYLQFPIVVLIKSCNILSVILVGVFCSRVKANSNQRLGKQKIFVGILVSIGVIIFFSGNQINITNSKRTSSIIGFCLLAVSVISDGFLPDFQAEVKQKFNPGPMVLYEKTNFWVFLLSFIYVVGTKQIFEIIQFMQAYPSLILDVLSESIMSCIGQMFVYYIIFNFKQHVAPFILTSRKIISAIVSIFIFKHPINIYQCIGIGLVILGIIFELTLTRIINLYREFKKYRSYDVI